MVPLHWSHNLYPAGFVPICSLGLSQIGRMNLGTDASTFKFYTMCGLQEGFEPFAVNMNRDVAVWFSKRLPTFVNVPKDHPHIEVPLHHGWVAPAGQVGQGTKFSQSLLSTENGYLHPYPVCLLTTTWDLHSCIAGPLTYNTPQETTAWYTILLTASQAGSPDSLPAFLQWHCHCTSVSRDF